MSKTKLLSDKIIATLQQQRRRRLKTRPASADKSAVPSEADAQTGQPS